jgi:hypothetical protein
VVVAELPLNVDRWISKGYFALIRQRCGFFFYAVPEYGSIGQRDIFFRQWLFVAAGIE